MKSKYNDWLEKEKLILIEGWARDGLTEEQIAHNMGIRRQTLFKWKNEYSDIGDALKKGKEVADYEVENALFKRALGYDYEEIISEKTSDGKTHIKKVKRHVPPDTTAMIYWLKNRRPDKWRDRIEVNNKNEENIIKAREILGGIESAIN